MSLTRRTKHKRTSNILSKTQFDILIGAEFRGERHQYMVGEGRAQFSGPGTAIDVRIGRGDRGINEIDNAAMIHDLDFMRIALSNDSEKDIIKKVRISDDKLKKKVNEIGGFNASITNAFVSGKNMAEDFNTIKRTAFIGVNENLKDNIEDETDFLNSVFEDLIDFNKTLEKIVRMIDGKLEDDFFSLTAEQQDKLIRDTYPLDDFENEEAIVKFIEKFIHKELK